MVPKKVKASILAALFVLGACGVAEAPEKARDEPAMASLPDAGWRFQESANGARLFYVSETDPASQVMILTCPAGVDRLIVRLPDVVPVGSEERLTIGHGNDLAVLVVDPMRDNGSVAGRGPIPDNLDTMLKQGIAAAYGSYSLGDLPAVPGETSARFISACS